MEVKVQARVQNGQLTAAARRAMLGQKAAPAAVRPTLAQRPRSVAPSHPSLRSVVRPATAAVRRPVAATVRRSATRPVAKPQPATPPQVAAPAPLVIAPKPPLSQPEPTLPPTNLKKTRLDQRIRHKLVGMIGLTVLAAGILGYLVYLNLPDISAKVSAMTVGIDTTFPSYIPEGYRLEKLPSVDQQRVVLRFVGASDSYTLTEERSSLSSEALYETIIRQAWPTAEVNKERGITLFINGHDAMWVNGGVLFTVSGSQALTARQIHHLAASLQ